MDAPDAVNVHRLHRKGTPPGEGTLLADAVAALDPPRGPRLRLGGGRVRRRPRHPCRTAWPLGARAGAYHAIGYWRRGRSMAHAGSSEQGHRRRSGRARSGPGAEAGRGHLDARRIDFSPSDLTGSVQRDRSLRHRSSRHDDCARTPPEEPCPAVTDRTPATAPEARLLVVDDEPNIRELLSASLRYAGFEVPPPPTASRRSRWRESFRPDLMVLDVMMPGLDGFGVVRRLRQRAGIRPVLFLTARDAAEDKVTGPHARRRRLRHQAVQPRRGARPHPRGAAPQRRRAAAADSPRLTFADIELDEETPRGHQGRRAHQPLAHGVQAAALPDGQRRPGAVEGADPGPRVELRLQRRGQRRRVLHLLPAPQGRHDRAAAAAHHPRGGLHARGCRAVREPRSGSPRPSGSARSRSGSPGRAARGAGRRRPARHRLRRDRRCCTVTCSSSRTTNCARRPGRRPRPAGRSTPASLASIRSPLRRAPAALPRLDEVTAWSTARRGPTTRTSGGAAAMSGPARNDSDHGLGSRTARTAGA